MDTSLNSILEVALQQGIWAALYIYLFFRMLKESAAREAKYQSMIEILSGNMFAVKHKELKIFKNPNPNTKQMLL